MNIFGISYELHLNVVQDKAIGILVYKRVQIKLIF